MKTSEQEFEETLGSLVDYYSNHTPGTVEAEARDARARNARARNVATGGASEAPVLFDAGDHDHAALQEADARQQERELAARVAARRQQHKTVRVAPPRSAGTRTWAWILGGALAMIVGGVATFALMVGPKDFWHMVRGTRDVSPNAASALPAPPIKAKGVPRAQPLGSGVQTALAGSGSGGPQAIPLPDDNDKDSDSAAATNASKASENRVTLRSAPDGSKRHAARPARHRAARPHARVEHARGSASAQHVRRAEQTTPRVRRPARRAKLSARAKTGSDWEDPYK